MLNIRNCTVPYITDYQPIECAAFRKDKIHPHEGEHHILLRDNILVSNVLIENLVLKRMAARECPF